MNKKESGFDLNMSQSLGNSGLCKIIDTPGREIKASKGYRVLIYYRGFLTDGRVFDMCQSPEDPYVVKIGSGNSMPGLEIACEGILKGESCRAYIPASLAYGERGHPQGVPPNSDLIFEIKVIDCIPPVNLETSISFNPLAAYGDFDGMKCYVIKSNIFFPEKSMTEILLFIKKNSPTDLKKIFEHYDFEMCSANTEHLSSLIERLADTDYLLLS